MMRPLRIVLGAACFVLGGCGAGARSAVPAPSGAAAASASEQRVPLDCEALRADADRAARSLESCRAASPVAAWAHGEAFEWLDEAVGLRLVATREGVASSTSGAQAQEIADRVWSLLDAIAGDLDDRALADRAEDAAEALLRGGDDEGRARALADLAGALAALRARLEPREPRTCEAEARAAAAAWLNAQAACVMLPDAAEPSSAGLPGVEHSASPGP